MRKASLLVRLENLAASFGFDLSLDMFPDDDIRARGDRGLRNPAGGRIRTGQSAIATIRAHAKSHMDKASKLEFGSLTERLCMDPFYAFNCAAQDMSPDCLKFLQRLSSAVLPIPTRTAQQIQEGVGVNVKAKILMIPDTSQREVDVSNEVFVFWKNKILRPGVFVGLYAMEHHRFEVLGFSGSFLSEENDVEKLKTEFVGWLSSDLQSIPSYENLVRADPRNIHVREREGVDRAKHGATEVDRPVRMHLTQGIDGPVTGGTSMMTLVPSQVGTMQIGPGTKITTERTGGVAADKPHLCTAGADAL